jgi:hypothetical protein
VVRLLSLVARLGLSVALALAALAAARWSPVDASPPFDVRLAPLAGPVLGFAILAALTGRDRRGGQWRPVALALLAAVVGLAAVVALRAPAGLAASVSSPAGSAGSTTPGAIDLQALPVGRRATLHWQGELRVPQSGGYVLWVEGRGRVAVSIDGRPVFEAAGDPLAAAKPIGLARGKVALDVDFAQVGPGLRLRLGWTRPSGRSEVIPPRLLGPPRSCSRCSRGRLRGSCRAAPPRRDPSEPARSRPRSPATPCSSRS